MNSPQIQLTKLGTRIFTMCLFSSILITTLMIGGIDTATGVAAESANPSQMASEEFRSIETNQHGCSISEKPRTATELGKAGTIQIKQPEKLNSIKNPILTAETFADVTRFIHISDSSQDTIVGIVPPADIKPAGYAYKGGDYICLTGKDSALWDGLMTHEYVHTRQEFAVNSEMEWIIESSAFYYMHIVPFERGTMGKSEANKRLAELEYDKYSSFDGTPVLKGSTEHAIWQYRGPPVLAALDSEIRDRTGGDRTLEAVFLEMNKQDREISYPVFKRIVSSVAGESMDEWLDTYIAGTEPVTPTQSQVANLSLTGPAAEPDLDVQYIKPLRGKRVNQNTSDPRYEIAKKNLDNIYVSVNSSNEYPTYPTIKLYATNSKDRRVDLGVEQNEPLTGSQTYSFPTDSQDVTDEGRLSSGTWKITVEAGEDTQTSTLTILEEKAETDPNQAEKTRGYGSIPNLIVLFVISIVAVTTWVASMKYQK